MKISTVSRCLFALTLFTHNFAWSSTPDACQALFTTNQTLSEQQATTLAQFISDNDSSKLSVQAAADALMVPKSTITGILSGKNVLTVDNAVLLSVALRVSIWDIIGFASNFRHQNASVYERFPREMFRLADTPQPIIENLGHAQKAHLGLILTLYALRHSDIPPLSKIANVVGLSDSYIYSVFSGQKLLTVNSAISIARALEINPKDVLAFLLDFDGLNFTDTAPPTTPGLRVTTIRVKIDPSTPQPALQPQKVKKTAPPKPFGVRAADLKKPMRLYELEYNVKKMQTPQLIELLGLKNESYRIRLKLYAKKLGVSESAMSDIVQGKKSLTTLQAVELSRILEVPIWDILGFVAEFKPNRVHSFSVVNDSSIRIKGQLSEKGLNILLRDYQKNHLTRLFMDNGGSTPTAVWNVARAIGVEARLLQSIINGETHLTISIAIAIARHFSIDPRKVLSYLERLDGLKKN